MTQPPNVSTSVKVLLILGGLALLATVWAWLTGAVFLQLIGGDSNAATPTTVYQYWLQYGSNKKVMAYLIGSALFAFMPCLMMLMLFMRNVRPAQHGDAQWATDREIQKSPLSGQKGIIVGQHAGKYLLFDGDQHVMLAAPTRSGKGVGIVIPNLLQWPESVFVLDVKRENFDLTAGFRRACGHQVVLFNPLAEDLRTHRWNPLSYVRRDPIHRVGDLQAIAFFLFPDPDKGDPIWSASARGLFVGIALYVMETPELPFTIGEIRRQATQQIEAGKHFTKVINERMESDHPLSYDCVSLLSDFIATSTNTRTSIRKTFTSGLELWAIALVDAATAENDFDFRQVRKRKISIYFACTPNNLGRLSPLINLFVQQLYDANTAVLPAADPEIKHHCLMLLDEFPAMGKLPIVTKGVAFVAGYWLRMLTIVQSPAQIREIYGHDAAESFIDNHAMSICYTPKNPKIAKEISETLGNQTWKVKSVSRSPYLFKSNKNESTSDQARALMLPQELMTLGQNSEILLLENFKPARVGKIRYYEDETFKSRLCPPPLIPEIKVGTLAAPTSAIEGVPADDDEKPALKTTTREFSASDMDGLNSLSADDFTVAYDEIEIAGFGDMSQDEKQARANSFLAAFGISDEEDEEPTDGADDSAARISATMGFNSDEGEEGINLDALDEPMSETA